MLPPPVGVSPAPIRVPLLVPANQDTEADASNAVVLLAELGYAIVLLSFMTLRQTKGGASRGGTQDAQRKVVETGRAQNLNRARGR
jgi:hypothetical protein